MTVRTCIAHTYRYVEYSYKYVFRYLLVHRDTGQYTSMKLYEYTRTYLSHLFKYGIL